MPWLGTWANRIEITVDSTNIDADLTHFPLMLKLNTSVGKDGQDLSRVFAEVTTNYQKIAVTDEDGTTQLYVEVEKWDNTVPEAVLWVSSSSFVIHSARDTKIFLYYDSTQDDNTTYVDIHNTAVAEAVWDSSYSLVDHMQDGASNASTYDSTSNDNDGTKKGANEPLEVAGEYGDAEDFDGTDDEIDYGSVDLTGDTQKQFTAEFTLKCDPGGGDYIISRWDGGEGKRSFIVVVNASTYEVVISDDGTLNATHSKDYERTGYYADGVARRFAFTFDGNQTDADEDNRRLRLYLNGARISESLLSINQDDNITTIFNSGAQVYAMATENNSVPNGWSEGVVDELRYSGAARSAAWIKADYYSLTDGLLTFNFCGDWLQSWKQRITITIDNTNVDSDLTHFPVMIKLGGAVGQNEQDITRVFDELGANNLKLAVTTDDGTSQLYVEIDQWDESAETAVLWVSRADWVVDSGADTTIYLYYDADKDDNSYYVGLTNSTPAERVWDEYYELVDHLNDGASNAATRDSTSNDVDGTKGGAAVPLQTDAKISYGQDFTSATPDKITYGNNVNLGTSDFTLEAIINTAIAAKAQIINKGSVGAGGKRYEMYVNGSGYLEAELDDNAAEVTITGTTSIKDSAYHYCAFTADRNGNGQCYVDGSANGSAVDISGSALTLDDAAKNLAAGVASDDETSDPFDNLMDELRISSTLRSAAWVKATYYTCWDDMLTYDAPDAKWLDGWDNRIKITIDSSKFDEAQSHFPVMIKLSTSCGASAQDMTRVFDELGSNHLKIAVTQADGETELYVEVEKWDSTNEESILWVSASDWHISSIIDTTTYLYYDNDHANNTSYVGVPNDVVCESVWDADYEAVWHMEDGADNQHIYDSTSNDVDGTKSGAGAPTEVTGKDGEAQDFDRASSEYIEFGDVFDSFTSGASAKFTFEGLLKCNDATSTYQIIMGKYDSTGGNREYLFALNVPDANDISFTAMDEAAGINTREWLANEEWAGLFSAYHHVQMSLDIAADTATICIDGVSKTVTKGPYGAITDMDNTAAAFALGSKCGGANPGNYFDGEMDEMRVSSAIRSVAWAKATYNTCFDTLITFTVEATTTPTVLVDIAWTTGAMSDTPDWYAIDSAGGDNQRCISYHFRKGRQHALARMQAGQADVTIKNFSGYFWPDKRSGPWYPYVKSGVKIRIRCIYNGVLYPRFVGFVDEWIPEWIGAPDNGPIMTLTITDGIESVANCYINNAGEAEEVSGVRIGNVLDEVSWPSADRDISTGAETLQATGAQENVNAIEHIYKVNESELGIIFVAFDGDMTWHGREVRDDSPYNSSSATFGDDDNEMPYIQIKAIVDRDLLYNDIRLTAIGGTEQTSSDATSQTTYGKRSLVITDLLNVSDISVASIAAYLCGRYKNATTLRVQSITLLPRAASSDLFPKAFLYDISTRITCRLRDAKLDRDYFIEGVEEFAEANTTNWRTSWQLSSVDQQLYTPEAVEETLWPNAAGDDTELTPLVGPANWQDVDSVDEATYNYPGAQGAFQDTYNMQNTSYGSGTINNITFYWRLWGGPGLPPSDDVIIKTGGVEFTTAYQYSNGWNTKSVVHTTNPDTGVAWTWANVNALQVGCTCSKDIENDSHRIGYCYMVVNFTPIW